MGTKDANIIFMNLTETWVTKAITDEADIKGFNVYRCDRTDNIKGGGVAIYVYEKLKIGQIWEKQYNRCEMNGIEIKDLQTINIVVYRPPAHQDRRPQSYT